jgi:hypothetical protein
MFLKYLHEIPISLIFLPHQLIKRSYSSIKDTKKAQEVESGGSQVQGQHGHLNQTALSKEKSHKVK